MRVAFNEKETPDEIPQALPGNPDIETSFSQSANSVGKLRLLGVANGGYQKKHPVMDTDGNILGHLLDGYKRIGYTYGCIYIDSLDAFFLTSSPIANFKNDRGFISIVRHTGTDGIFSGVPKFEKTNSISIPFGRNWGRTKGFKRLATNDLFILTGHGFGVFNPREERLHFSTVFDDDDMHSVESFSISPNQGLLIILFHDTGNPDPITGGKRYIKAYDLKNGEELGKLSRLSASDIDGELEVLFSENGHSIFITGDEYRRQYELIL